MMVTLGRVKLNFLEEARKAFAFLSDLGFSEIDAQPTLICYQNDGVEVDVYHGKHSYEVGAGVAAFGARYSIAEIIRHLDPQVGKHFRYSAATTPEGVVVALADLSLLVKRYGRAALNGDEELMAALAKETISHSEEYALDVLEEQLRPLANEAFREKDYVRAFELYSRIKDRLNPSELKKLTVAEKRRRA